MQHAKILVTGSTGTVGSYIPSLFQDASLILTTKADLDITDNAAVLRIFKKLKPDAVIHLAAATNLDFCEKNKRLARSINFLGTKHIALAAKIIDATLVYMSTTAIFDGKKKYYTEKDLANPLSTYGKTKYLGEEFIRENIKKHFIVRSGWIIGGGIREKKFISYIMQQLQDGKKEILAVDDMYGSITYAKELVIFIKNLLKKPTYGTYHFGSKGTCSRYEIASFLGEMLKTKATIKPVSATFFNKTFFAPRPKYEVVKSIKKQFDQTWQESLENYIRNEIQTTSY